MSHVRRVQQTLLVCAVALYDAFALPTPKEAPYTYSYDPVPDAGVDTYSYDPFLAHELNGLRAREAWRPVDDAFDTYDAFRHVGNEMTARRTREFELRVDDLELVPSPSPWKAKPGPCPALAIEIGFFFEQTLHGLTAWEAHPDETRAFELAYHRLRDAVCADGGGAPSPMLETAAL
jgi:hypothetical protein